MKIIRIWGYTGDVHVLGHNGTKGGDVDGHGAVDEGVEHHNVDGRDVSEGAPGGEEAGEADAEHGGHSAGEGVQEEHDKQKLARENHRLAAGSTKTVPMLL